MRKMLVLITRFKVNLGKLFLSLLVSDCEYMLTVSQHIMHQILLKNMRMAIKSNEMHINN